MIRRFLQSWYALFGRRRNGGLSVCLYTRAGCCACNDAKAILDRALCRFGYVLTTIDVDTDPMLTRLYGLEVPVVTVAGRVRFRGRVNEVLLIRLLRGELGS
jgi:glutaredoxin